MAAPGSQDRVGILTVCCFPLRLGRYAVRTADRTAYKRSLAVSMAWVSLYAVVVRKRFVMHCRARGSILRMYSTSAICIQCARAEAACVSARKRRCEGQVCLRRLRVPRTWPHQDRKIESEFFTVCCFALRLGRYAVRTADRTAYKRSLAVSMAWVSLYAVAVRKRFVMHCRARDSILRLYSTFPICLECARAECATDRRGRREGQVCLRRLRVPRTWPHQERKIESEILTVCYPTVRLR